MEQILETVINTLNELLSSTIKLIPAILMALIIILVTRYVAKILKEITQDITQKTIKSKSLQFLFSKTIYITSWILGILAACLVVFPGLRLGDIIATLGLGSVAIGFAFQDIFKNFLAGILLLIQQPFRIDDQIIVGDYEGTVQKIDIRTTKILTYTGEQIILPNAVVFTSAVQVRTAYTSRRTDLAVGVDYNTDLLGAIHLLKQVIFEVEGVLPTPTPEIDLLSFGDSSINLTVRYWTLSQQSEVRRTQTKVIVAIKKAFDQAGIAIPYPIRTLYFSNQDKNAPPKESV